MDKFLIIPKLNFKPIPVWNTTCDDISLEHSIEDLKEKLSGAADRLEIYSFESLMDENSIKHFKTINLVDKQ